MMWGVTLIVVFYLAAQLSSDEIKLDCYEDYGLPDVSNFSPSFLEDLKVELVEKEGNYLLNISWAISIDASLKYLTGTRLIISYEKTYVCEYIPSLAKAKVKELTKKWFSIVEKTSSGSLLIQAANIPLPPLWSGVSSKAVNITVPTTKPGFKVTPEPTQSSIGFKVTPEPTQASIGSIKVNSKPTQVPTGLGTQHVTIAIFGGLAALMILSSCYLIYKKCKADAAKSFGFKSLLTSSPVPVPILMVYSAENSLFHNAVVALAEFLQWHGGCSVAVDMWQQGKIAELGPMRWLAEQIKAADRVLIVCPKAEAQPSLFPITHSVAEHSIPAAAHDLYPLILNTVASCAKSSSELTKFWVVQLGKQQDKRPSNVAPELRACKTFCLMKNLNKLCKSLHAQRQDKKISGLSFRPWVSYSEHSTVKLRDAVEMLIKDQANIPSKSELSELLISS